MITLFPYKRRLPRLIGENPKNLKPFSLNIEEATRIKPDVRVKKEDSLKGKIDRY